MRVAVVGPTAPHSGGIVDYAHNLCNALAAEGAEVRLLTFTALFPRLLYQRRGTAAATVPLSSRVSTFRILHYARLVRSSSLAEALAGVQVVHLQAWTGFLAPAMMAVVREARRKGIPVVTTLHNVAPHERGQSLLLPLQARLARASDLVIVHAPSLVPLAESRLGVSRSRLVDLEHAQDAPALDRRPEARQAARARLGIPPDGPLVLQFGTIRAYKGIDVMLHALVQLPGHRLLVAGEPWEDWGVYRRMASSLGVSDRIHALPRFIAADELPTLFQAADVAAYPYTGFEAASGSAALAGSFGVPAVASRVGAFPDQLPHAALALPSDPVSLASAVRTVLKDPSKGALRRPPVWRDMARTLIGEYARCVRAP